MSTEKHGRQVSCGVGHARHVAACSMSRLLNLHHPVQVLGADALKLLSCLQASREPNLNRDAKERQAQRRALQSQTKSLQRSSQWCTTPQAAPAYMSPPGLHLEQPLMGPMSTALASILQQLRHTQVLLCYCRKVAILFTVMLRTKSPYMQCSLRCQTLSSLCWEACRVVCLQ